MLTRHSAPTILLAATGNTSYEQDPLSAVYNSGSNLTVRHIWYSPLPANHPMHLHGHDMKVLSQGHGTWDGTIVRPDNPQRRDTVMMDSANATVPSYTVFEWEANNPGAWLVHCHIAWHISEGLSVTMLVGRGDSVPAGSRADYVSGTTRRDRSHEGLDPQHRHG
jgi:hypothetical protein